MCYVFWEKLPSSCGSLKVSPFPKENQFLSLARQITFPGAIGTVVSFIAEGGGQLLFTLHF